MYKIRSVFARSEFCLVRMLDDQGGLRYAQRKTAFSRTLPGFSSLDGKEKTPIKMGAFSWWTIRVFAFGKVSSANVGGEGTS